jgi:hypothetical protein
VSEKAIQKSTRRDLLRLAGAAAIGAAGASALSGVKVKAGGSGTPLVAYLNPIHVASGHLNAGQEVVIGPFSVPVSGSVFGSDDYWGMVGNLTALRWKGQGWMSVRSTDYPFDPANQALNLNFGGHQVDAWSNSFVTIFGLTGTVIGKTTTGQFALRNGPAPADYVVDILAFLGPDQ